MAERVLITSVEDAAPRPPITVRQGSDAEEGEAIVVTHPGEPAVKTPMLDPADPRIVSRREEGIPSSGGSEEGRSWFDTCVM